jgi:glycosyltransferase involved in cell wall biosynthesis
MSNDLKPHGERVIQSITDFIRRLLDLADSCEIECCPSERLQSTNRGWHEFRKYLVKKDTENAFVVSLRSVYSEGIFFQNLVDFFGDEHPSGEFGIKNWHLAIIYFCNDVLLSKRSCEYDQVDSSYLLNNCWKSVGHYYSGLSKLKYFNINSFYEKTKVQYYSTTVNLLQSNKKDKKSSALKEGGLRLQGLFKRDQNIPLISVITTVCNNRATIKQTIQSVINQNYDNVEYIIVDAGSTDGTLDILEEYSGTIDYWVSERDQGIYYGLDKGLRLACGSHLMVLNSDDVYFDSNVISEVADNITKYPEADFFSGNICFINQDRSLIFKKSDISSIIYRNTIFHPTLVIRKEDYVNAGGFDFEFKIAADYDLVLNLISRQLSYKKIDKTLVYFRKGGISYLNNSQIDEYYRILKKHNLIDITTFLNILKLIFKRKLLNIRNSIITKFQKAKHD